MFFLLDRRGGDEPEGGAAASSDRLRADLPGALGHAAAHFSQSLSKIPGLALRQGEQGEGC
jgi:hypothetical protein